MYIHCDAFVCTCPVLHLHCTLGSVLAHCATHLKKETATTVIVLWKVAVVVVIVVVVVIAVK